MMSAGSVLQSLVRGTVLVMLVMAAFAAGHWASVTRAQQEAAPRTQYEGLDLSSPQSAAETFIALFERGDYPALFLVLSPEAQRSWRVRPAATFDYTTWFRDETLLDRVASLSRDLPDEHDSALIPMIFDEVMVLAEANDAFVIDLRGVSLNDAEPEAFEQADLSGYSIEGRLADGSPVTFILAQSPSGRWRVHQVIVPGGDVDILPWSAVYD